MLNFDIYVINTEDSERSNSDKEAFLTFEEAMENRKRYANWFRPTGDVWIKKYSSGSMLAADEEWHIDADGSVYSHYNWKEIEKRHNK